MARNSHKRLRRHGTLLVELVEKLTRKNPAGDRDSPAGFEVNPGDNSQPGLPPLGVLSTGGRGSVQSVPYLRNRPAPSRSDNLRIFPSDHLRLCTGKLSLVMPG